MAVKAIYAGPSSTLDNTQIYPGFSFGSEISWAQQEQSLSDSFSIPILQNLVYNNLTYDYRSFNFGSDVKDIDTKAGVFIDEITTDLSAFQQFGGKMLVTQGWADPLNAAEWPIQHLQDIKQEMGEDEVDKFFSLFMVPGGGHCGATTVGYADVPATYHTLEKLVQWVEKGDKPEYVVSTGPVSGKNISRLLCPWPRTAKLNGTERSPWNWESYVCS